MSAYVGLCGAEAAYVRDRGGFDLIFCGRHAGEDQDLGRRLATHAGDGECVFVHEPPFAWHPEHAALWSAPRYSNLCEVEHALRPADLAGHAVRQGAVCPYFEADFDHLTGTEVVLLFDPACVEMAVEERQ